MKKQFTAIYHLVGKEWFNLLCVLLLYLCAYIIIFDRPLDVQQWQWADDALFFDNGNAMINNFGKIPWLGPFTEVLLAKNQMLPLFTALSISSGISLRTLEFCLYAPLPLLFLFGLRPLHLPKVPLFYMATLCLLFIPAAGLSLRLGRTTLFGAMVLYTMLFMTTYLVHIVMLQRNSRVWIFLTGIGIGCATMTREEGIWLFAPALLALLVSVVLGRIHPLRWPLLVTVLLLAAGYQLPSTAFSLLNYQSYGIFSPSLRQNESHKTLYSLLASIEPDKKSRYVPCSTSARKAVYAVSPKFRELKPFLEGSATDDLATNRGHHYISGWWDRLEEREFFVSTFEWALTRAIYLSGRTSSVDFLGFCDDVTQEIRQAIDSGKVTAGKSGLGLLPPLEPRDVPRLIRAVFHSLYLLGWPPKIDRDYFLPINPDLSVAFDWHTSLGTWPAKTIGNPKRVPDIVFNKLLIPLFKFSYCGICFLAFICLFVSFRRERQTGLVFLGLMVVSAGGLFAFSVVMGVMDTIAWEILKTPESYNYMGQFPLHFLLLISMASLMHSVPIVRGKKFTTVE